MQACLEARCIFFFFFFLESAVVFIPRLISSPKGHVGITARKVESVILACTRAIWVAAQKRKMSHWVPEFFQIFVGQNPWICLVILHLFKIYQLFLIINCVFISHCLDSIWETHYWFQTSTVMCWMLSSVSKPSDTVFSLYLVELRWQHKKDCKACPSKCNPSEGKYK